MTLTLDFFKVLLCRPSPIGAYRENNLDTFQIFLLRLSRNSYVEGDRWQGGGKVKRRRVGKLSPKYLPA
jgi:hypothetical protein